MFIKPQRLRELGILGMNKRNVEYISRFNERARYPLVDDKVQTKRLAEEAGIAVPELYGVVRIHREVEELDALLAPYDDFVIKPAHGSGGNEDDACLTLSTFPGHRLQSLCDRQRT